MSEIDLNEVRTYVEVGEAGTFIAAAKQLQLPTSTISRAITRLEKHLGIQGERLFRTNRYWRMAP